MPTASSSSWKNNLKIMHLLAQRPGLTGSGHYLRGTVMAAFLSGHENAVIAGVPADDPCLDLPFGGIPGCALFRAVTFSATATTATTVTGATATTVTTGAARETIPQLNFPVTGMSDVMPYVSTIWRNMSPSMLHAWEEAFKKTIAECINEFRPHLIISHHLWLLTAIAAEIALERSIPIVGVCHGTCLRQMTLVPDLASRILPALGRLNAMALLNSHQEFQVLNMVEEGKFGSHTEKISADKIPITGIAGSGFNNEIFNQATSEAERFGFAYAGKLSASKGLPSLLRAFDSLRRKMGNHRNPEYRLPTLTIAGGGAGEEAAELKKMAESIEGVTLAGLLDQKGLAELFRTCRAMVLPSFYEGLPLVMAESLACGARVIATDLPGLAQWVGPELLSHELVTLIPMPPMLTIDTPEPAFLSDFEKSLEKAMEKVLEKTDEQANEKADESAYESAYEKERQSDITTDLNRFLDNQTWPWVLNRIVRLFRPAPSSALSFPQ
jgi:glycosyltransferase involved in cell wall biosynthesis